MNRHEAVWTSLFVAVLVIALLILHAHGVL